MLFSFSFSVCFSFFSLYLFMFALSFLLYVIIIICPTSKYSKKYHSCYKCFPSPHRSRPIINPVIFPLSFPSFRPTFPSFRTLSAFFNQRLKLRPRYQILQLEENSKNLENNFSSRFRSIM